MALRNQRHFALPKWKTDRFKNAIVLSSCLFKAQLNDSVLMLLHITCMNQGRG